MIKLKIIIAGSRYFNNYCLLKSKLDILLSNRNNNEIQIVSGGCRGSDKLGELYAMNNGIDIKIFNAQWDKYGKSAGPKRNLQMAIYSDALVAFWDGKSRGTSNMIEVAKQHNLIIRVIRI